MSEAFDAYYKWLAIPPDEQPPNHYRLLGVRTFEPDADVIANAADRQMAHIKLFQAARHSALSQKILNEISAARVCLLNPEKRAAYDALLREQSAAKEPVKSEDSTSGIDLGFDVSAGPRVVVPPPSPRARRRSWQFYAAIAAGAAAVILFAAVVVSRGRKEKPAQVKVDKPEPVRTTQGPAKSEQPAAPPTAKTEPSKPAAATEPDISKPSPPSPSAAKQPDQTSVPNPPSSATPTPAAAASPSPNPQPSAPPPAVAPSDEKKAKKHPVPDASAQEQARKLVQGAFREQYDKATTPDAQASLAQELLRKTQTSGEGVNAQYVLFQEAGRLAVGAKHVELALQVVDQMEANFAIDALAMKIGALATIGISAKLPPEQLQALVEQAFPVIDEAVAQDRFDAAERLGNATTALARRSKDAALLKRAVARNKELKAEIEALKGLEADVKKATAGAPKRPPRQPARQEANDRSVFVGQWICPNKKGGTFIATLNNDNTASSSLSPQSIARWEYVQGEVRAVFPSGSRWIIRREGQQFQKIYFRAGLTFDSPPTETDWITKARP